MFHRSPDPRALMHHPGGGQCAVEDAGYRCTMVLGHDGDDHHTWSHRLGVVTRSWGLARRSVCAQCGPLPAGERLHDYGSDKVHAVVVRHGDSPGSYYGPTPDEVEPCGPVTTGRGFHGTLRLEFPDDYDAQMVVLSQLAWVGAWQTFVIPAGTTTDLASVPASCTWLIARYGHGVTRAAVLHDLLRRSGQVSDRDADGIFRLALEDAGVSELRAEMMWAAVRIDTRLSDATREERLRVLRLLPTASLLLLPTPMVWAWQGAFRRLET